MSGYSKLRKLNEADLVYLELTAKGLGKVPMDPAIGYEVQCVVAELEELREDAAALPAGSTIAELLDAVQEVSDDVQQAENRISDLEDEVVALQAELAALRKAA